jgi:hypothetical protein
MDLFYNTEHWTIHTVTKSVVKHMSPIGNYLPTFGTSQIITWI